MILVIEIPTWLTMGYYHNTYSEMTENQDSYEKEVSEETLTSDGFMENFVEAAYIFYNTERTDERTAEHADQIEKYLNEYSDNYYEVINANDFRYYLDYQAVDEKGDIVAKSETDDLSEKLGSGNLASYSLVMRLVFDENGSASGTIEKSEYRQRQQQTLDGILAGGLSNTSLGRTLSETEGEIEEDTEEGGLTGASTHVSFETPKNRTYTIVMSNANLTTYLKGSGEELEEELGYVYVDEYTLAPDRVINNLLFCMLAVCAAALLLPCFKSLRTGDEKVFMVPFELPVIIIVCVIAAATELIGVRIIQTHGAPFIEDFFLWTAVYAFVYWCAACLRHVFTLGPVRYIKEYSLCVVIAGWLGRETKKAVKSARGGLDKLYHSFDDVDFSEKNNKTILKLVLINFAVLFVITCMWVVGIVALIIYSFLLFFVLRKYFNDLKGKYEKILCATGEMAEGNLEITIDGDLGIFNSFAGELEKIQGGYRKAVEREVKSQRMKTELITNVSHDLKTPLTAIITYVNLLKEETDEEKRKEYIDVLERKSMRLKVLIEDLFEISKVSSNNVTLHLSDVDIVNLFKQVRLELQEKCDAAKLELRVRYPEEKLVCELDGQKTYRIFENLLVNVTKYAMENTRVYVNIERKEHEAVVQIMNISANELKVSPEELTERFVRGDEARNTEGSGLGLAIAKSFTEVQKGRFEIETEGDLFKVTVSFPLK